MQLARLVFCRRAGRAVVPLFDSVFSLVEPVGYGGNHPQHHDHPYAHPNERHSLFCLLFTVYSLQLIALTDQMGLPGYHL